MVTMIVEKRYGSARAAIVRSRVTASSIARAVEIAGPGAMVVFPLDAETFFAPDDAREAVEDLAEPSAEVAVWAAA